MPNAKDISGLRPHKILMLGNTGTGKTSAFTTLPGRKFVYIFDPNALETLKGHDIEYETFFPTSTSWDIKSLTKGKGDDIMGVKNSKVYTDFEKHVEEAKKSHFFDQFDVLAIDSATTLLDCIMDRVLTINGRPGTFPQQDDWGPQMVAFTNIVRELTGSTKTIYLTGHLKTDKDEHTQSITQLPLFTGQLREKLPLLFSDIFVTSATTDATGKVKYQIRTVPNSRETPIRTGIKGLNASEDVTIDWSKTVVGQGLGGIILREQAGHKV